MERCSSRAANHRGGLGVIAGVDDVVDEVLNERVFVSNAGSNELLQDIVINAGKVLTDVDKQDIAIGAVMSVEAAKHCLESLAGEGCATSWQ